MWIQRKASEWQLYRRKRYPTLVVEDKLDHVPELYSELPSKHLHDLVGWRPSICCTTSRWRWRRLGGAS
jgi:hypothetical protein